MGFTLTRHHGAPTTANASTATAPKRTVLQPPAILPAATTGKHTHRAHAGAYLGPELAASANSNQSPTQPRVIGHTDAPSSTSTGVGKGAGTGTQPQGNDHPATSGTNSLPHNGAGEYAYAGYAPLDCELPAGCGAMSGGTSHGGRRPSGTSGALPFVHNSQGSSNTPGDPPPQTNSGTSSPPGNTPGQSSDPPGPGTNPPVTPAPELDPATLVAAMSLLFGSLAVLLSRRVRVTR